MSHEPTQRQLEVLWCAARFIQANGYGPSMRDLSEALGGISTNAVFNHLAVLERLGFITRAKGVARSISVTKEGREALGK